MRPVFVLALFLAGCSAGPFRTIGAPKGPGVDDTSCENEVPPSATAPGGVAQTASAEGGQRASNQPTQTDPGARGINTVWNRGAGPNTNSPVTTETRSQAGAPSVNQGLILPTSAENGGGSSASIEAAKSVAAIRAALQLAMTAPTPNMDLVASYSKMLAEAQAALAAAEQGARPQIVYNLQGAVSTQTVANGSKSGGGDNQDAVTVPKGLAPSLAPRTIKAAGAAPVDVPEQPAAPAPEQPK